MLPSRPNVKGLLEIRDLIRRHEPRIMHHWMYHGALAGGVATMGSRLTPIVWGIHNGKLLSGKDKFLTRCVSWILARHSHRWPSKIVFCAKSAETAHLSAGYCGRNSVVIPNGCDLATFTVCPHLRSEGQRLLRSTGSSGPPLLGMVARYNPLKGHSVLIEALSSLAKRGIAFRCALIGDGVNESNAELANLIARANLRDKVVVVGAIERVPAAMNAIDILVLPSLGEAFPNVVVEAMACGTPCVASDVGDVGSILGESGWLVPPGNPEALALAISQAISEMGTNKWCGRLEEARKRIQNDYSLERMVQRYNSVWCEVVRDAA